MSKKLSSEDFFRQRLKDILKSKRMTITELAEMAQVERQTIYDTMKAKYTFRFNTGESIANALGYTLSQFIRQPDEKGDHDIEECMRRVQIEWLKRGSKR